jgi:hypothetical protein
LLVTFDLMTNVEAVRQMTEEPIPSVLAGMPTFTWNDEESVAYEVAIEAISQVVAWYTALIAAEQRRAQPDSGRIAEWEAGQARAIAERNGLRSTDHDAVTRVQREYRRLADQLAAAADK